MTDERLTAYLLQELTKEEAEQFEDQCFAHEKWPADLDSAEQDLIDAYLCNELSEDRQLRFENNYLTTDARKARFLTARSLLRILTQAPAKKEPLSSILVTLRRNPLVLPVAVVILVVIAVWLLLPAFGYIWRLRESSTAIFLKMSADDVKVTLPFRYDVLRIYLILPAPSPDTTAYRVQWEDAGRILGNLKADRGKAGVLIVSIPKAKLKEGQYVLKLYEIDRKGSESRVSGGYYFTAEEKDLEWRRIE